MILKVLKVLNSPDKNNKLDMNRKGWLPLPAFSPLPTMFSRAFILSIVQTLSDLVKRLLVFDLFIFSSVRFSLYVPLIHLFLICLRNHEFHCKGPRIVRPLGVKTKQKKNTLLIVCIHFSFLFSLTPYFVAKSIFQPKLLDFFLFESFL